MVVRMSGMPDAPMGLGSPRGEQAHAHIKRLERAIVLMLDAMVIHAGPFADLPTVREKIEEAKRALHETATG